MARPSCTLRLCKWAATLGCALIMAAFVGSRWYTLRYRVIGSTDRHLMIVNGRMVVERFTIALPDDSGQWKRVPGDQPGWHLEREPVGWDPRTFVSVPSLVRLPPPNPLLMLHLPLWLPFLIFLILTLLLWRRDRRKPRPGFCPDCDYDLTGNTTGRCPECGLQIPAAPPVTSPKR